VPLGLALGLLSILRHRRHAGRIQLFSSAGCWEHRRSDGRDCVWTLDW
jgi:hypothetical protein